MPKAYWVVQYKKIKNPDKLAAYAKLAGPAIQAAGGRFLVRGNPAKTYEHGLSQRTVVTEWGAADLYGRSIRERAQALIDIAHPDFRGQLEAQARLTHYL